MGESDRIGKSYIGSGRAERRRPVMLHEFISDTQD